jgi:hypothetical protein
MERMVRVREILSVQILMGVRFKKCMFRILKDVALVLILPNVQKF